jgi:transposase
MAAECLFTWDWLADFGAVHRMLFVHGPALSMKAIPGGKAKHDTLEAHTIAVLLRGGMLPQASGYPALRRTPRDRLRRCLHLARKRGALLPHVHHTHSPYNLPALGQKLADTANRHGVAERVADPAVQKSLAIDLALIGSDAEVRRALELAIVKAARRPDAHTRDLLRTVPGSGKMLSLVVRYEMHDRERFPRGQEFASYCRLGKGAKESAGQRAGTSGTHIGYAHLTWAFSEAAVLCLRAHPAAQ